MARWKDRVKEMIQLGLLEISTEVLDRMEQRRMVGKVIGCRLQNYRH